MRRYRIPFRVPFRGLTAREGFVFEGPHGWAEWSPLPWRTDEEGMVWRRAADEAANDGWPPPVRHSIPVNVTVPDVDAETAHRIVALSGCTTAKVKVGTVGDDERVAAVRDALGPGGAIRLDANGAWSVDDAERAIARLQRHGLEYVEQPVESLDEMCELRRRIDVPLAVDEPARSVEGAVEAARREAADVLIVKVQPIGGVRAGLEAAERSGLPVVVSSALETSIGLAAGVALAAALPELPYACGLGTLLLLEGDITDAPLLPVDGRLPVRRPAVSERALSRWEIAA
jgi:O-succinylbenzoate synthase